MRKENLGCALCVFCFFFPLFSLNVRFLCLFFGQCIAESEGSFGDREKQRQIKSRDEGLFFEGTQIFFFHLFTSMVLHDGGCDDACFSCK